MRRRMLWTAGTLLVVLAIVEAALALMRDVLMADKQALIHPLAVAQPAIATDGWMGAIPTAGQMLLGFILPFALAFIAIPLESLIHSSRTVRGIVVLGFVRLAAFFLRLLGHFARHASRVVLSLYDVVIVLPLLAERLGRRLIPSAAAAGAVPIVPDPWSNFRISRRERRLQDERGIQLRRPLCS